ncbi:copper-sensitivity suppressor membrane protein A [Salmonella bongori]|nr:copper-sensitivity suppressor membrane protein A [Salmonella bongori]
MAKQQRMGWWFSMPCMCRGNGLYRAAHGGFAPPCKCKRRPPSEVVSAYPSTDDASPVTPCELSAKSLLATPPVLFEGAILALCLLLSLLAPVRVMRLPFSPPRVISPPTLRVHLRFCVFRE